MEKYVGWLILALISGVISSVIAKRKGRDAAIWFMLGIIFNVLSVLILVNLKKYRPQFRG